MKIEIPKTLEECYIEIDKITEEGDFIQQFLKLDEDRATATVHSSLGRWIRNTWGLWSGDSELCKWFNSNEIKHPDDMSSIILTSYYRYKNDKEIQLEEQFEHFILYWLDDNQKLMRKRKKKLNNIDNA